MSDTLKTANIIQLSRSKQRLIDTAAQIWGESALKARQLGFLHTLHANCYLPRTAQKEDHYVHRNGPFSILVEAGRLLNPTTETWEKQPLPYGGKPRALFVHLQSYAVRHRTPDIPLGNSFTDFVKMMNGGASGGEKGNIRLWKKQLMYLAASTIRVGVPLPGVPIAAKTKKFDIADEIEVWFPTNPKQLSLFPSSVRLSRAYYEHLIEHAMPVDLRALRDLVHDPLAFDVFMWLCYRLCRVKEPKGCLVTWEALHGQFGTGYKLLKHFKPRFVDAVRKALTLYPGAKVDAAGGGIVIRTSAPPIPRSNSVRQLPHR